jgi:ATP-grasp domain
MIAEALDIARETYLAFLMDRANNGPVMVGSPMGGMDIEEVAHKHPEALHTVFHLPVIGIYAVQPIFENAVCMEETAGIAGDCFATSVFVMQLLEGDLSKTAYLRTQNLYLHNREGSQPLSWCFLSQMLTSI